MFKCMRQLPHTSFIAIVASVLVLSAPAQACPKCSTAEIVRASVFDDRFWTHLLLIILPLVVLAVITAFLYRVGLERPRPANTPSAVEVRTSHATARIGEVRP